MVTQTPNQKSTKKKTKNKNKTQNIKICIECQLYVGLHYEKGVPCDIMYS